MSTWTVDFAMLSDVDLGLAMKQVWNCMYSNHDSNDESETYFGKEKKDEKQKMKLIKSYIFTL